MVAIVGVAALAVATAAERVVPGDYPTSDWLPDAATGLALVGCGLAVAAVSRSDWTAGLLAAAGLTWFVPNFAHSSPTWLGTAAANGVFLHRAPLLQAVAAYPAGRTREPVALVAITAAYLAAFVPGVWQSDVGAGVIAALVVAATAVGVRRAVGRRRRQRLVAFGAAITFAGWVAASIVVRHAVSADTSMLTAYQLDVVAVALLLTVPMLVRRAMPTDVVDLVVELRGIRTAALRDRLASALGDPSLQIGYWVPSQHGYVDAAGRPVDVSARPGHGITPLDLDGSPVAVLLHDPGVLDDAELLPAVTSATRLGVAHARLQAEMRARLVEAEESRRRIVDAAAESRRRLELQLTDGVLRRLDEVDRALLSAADADGVPAVRERLARAREDVVQLARGIFPARVADRPLAEVLTALVRSTPMPVEVDVTVERVPERIASCIWFVCAETVANAVKYAAASRLTLQVRALADAVVVTVTDDGVGGADAERGSGLHGLADRVAALGGSLSVESPKGVGTSVTATLPMAGRG